MNTIKNEPVLAAVTALLVAGGTLLAAFGVHLTGVQIAAVSQFVQTAYVLAYLVRSQVTPKDRLPYLTHDAAGVAHLVTP